MAEQSERNRIAHLARTCAGINLRQASQAITNFYDDRLVDASGLRITQIMPLVVLYLGGPQPIHAIAERLGLDRTTLARNLKPLEKSGLIQMAPGQDQRTRVATLTPHGKRVLLKALPVWEDVQAQVVAGMGETRFQSLLTQLSAVAQLARQSEAAD